MSVDRSFAQKLARRRNPPDAAYSLIVFGLVVVGVAVTRLFREESPAFGLAVDASSPSAWGWIITYRYTDSQGNTRSGQSGYLPRREATACRVGDACVIRYDPARPASSVWIGKPGLRKEPVP